MGYAEKTLLGAFQDGENQPSAFPISCSSLDCSDDALFVSVRASGLVYEFKGELMIAYSRGRRPSLIAPALAAQLALAVWRRVVRCVLIRRDQRHARGVATCWTF